MAEVIQLASRRSERLAREAPTMAPPTLYFDLSSPDTYLVAERVERRCPGASWRPAAFATRGGVPETDDRATQRARMLRMPLVWPERFPGRVPLAMRVATWAAERGCAASFAIAAGRLAFCGGFDIEELEIVAEAAAAAGLDVDDAILAARDTARDHRVAHAALGIERSGGTDLPALRCGDHLYCGELRISAWLAQHGCGTTELRPSAS